jgi:hypothetical protein
MTESLTPTSQADRTPDLDDPLPTLRRSLARDLARRGGTLRHGL